MVLDMRCPNCSRLLRLTADAVGHPAQCAACGAAFRVPESLPPSPQRSTAVTNRRSSPGGVRAQVPGADALAANDVAWKAGWAKVSLGLWLLEFGAVAVVVACLGTGTTVYFAPEGLSGVPAGLAGLALLGVVAIVLFGRGLCCCAPEAAGLQSFVRLSVACTAIYLLPLGALAALALVHVSDWASLGALAIFFYFIGLLGEALFMTFLQDLGAFWQRPDVNSAARRLAGTVAVLVLLGHFLFLAWMVVFRPAAEDGAALMALIASYVGATVLLPQHLLLLRAARRAIAPSGHEPRSSRPVPNIRL